MTFSICVLKYLHVAKTSDSTTYQRKLTVILSNCNLKYYCMIAVVLYVCFPTLKSKLLNLRNVTRVSQLNRRHF